jgi:hypothetical protein
LRAGGEAFSSGDRQDIILHLLDLVGDGTEVAAP